MISIYWLKRDLRFKDNDALYAALNSNKPLLLLYIYERSLEIDRHYSERHWRFVFESLDDLNQQLKAYDSRILVLHSEVIPAFKSILELYQIDAVYSTEESGLKLTYNRDINFALFCKNNSIKWHEFQNGGVVRGLRNRNTWRNDWYAYMLKTIKPIHFDKADLIKPQDLPEELLKVDYKPQFTKEHKMQSGGRTEGKKWEDSFFNDRLKFYSDYISKPEMSRVGCSRLSPYFAWGCISIREVYQRSIQLKNSTPYKKQLSAFRSRLRWQAHYIQKFEMEPRIEFEAFNKGYLELDQPCNNKFVAAWKSGTTGFPLVDASIRAVIATGYLNFRMRTMCVSFLLHHLFQHFTTGADWLARQFLDFEPGIHYAQFQMQAGLTATNTIRIYNPTKNALDHDPEAVFIQQWVPELSQLPPNLAIEPWLMNEMEQQIYGFRLGENYPYRIVDIKETRAFALEKLYGLRKNELTRTEKQRILDVHTLKRKTL